jgi:SulP family sulfate permease
MANADTTGATWLYRRVPALDSLRHYTPENFRRDLVAGLTVAAVAVPQAMAYASIVGLPVQYGLYTAIVMTAVGALFDSSKQLINGPTNAISIAVLSALGAIGVTDASVAVETKVAAAVLLAFMIGVIQTGISLLRLGDLTRYISHAVIVGFTAGAAMLLILDQLKNFLGLTAQGGPHDHFLWRWWQTMSHGGSVHRETVAIGAGTIVFVLALNWINRRLKWRIPELLLAVIIAAAAVYVLDLDQPRLDDAGQTVSKEVKTIGKIPQSLPTFQLPTFDWSLARQLSGSALAIGMLGLLEAMSMAKAIAARTQQKIDMNQQCLSEGLANIVGSFFQCYAGSGSLTRSAINHQAGAATQWSGVISAIAVAATMLIFAPWAQYIPRAALAGVLIVSAFRMVDSHKLAYHLRVTRMDGAIVLATAIAAVAVSIEFCILIGVFLSFLIYLPRAAKAQATRLVITPEQVIREAHHGEETCNRLLLYNVEGELFFGSSPDFEAILDRVHEQAEDGAKVVVLRLKHARNLDGVCLDLLLEAIDRLAAKQVAVLLCGVREEMMTVLTRAGVEERLGPGRIFREKPATWSSTSEAVERAYEIIGADTCTECPMRRDFGQLGLLYDI